MNYQLFAPDRRPAPSADTTVFGDPAGSGNPLTFHRNMPGYAATPLLDSPLLARSLGVATVLVKDESSRLGLPSFKMLGASYATARAIEREWLAGTANGAAPAGSAPTVEALRSRLASRPGARLVAATDGNHGRGVARMAALLGLECLIFVPAGTAAARISDIEGEGAQVEIVDGTYDDAIARSAKESDADTLVISDTSWDGYTRTPADVIVGYSTMFAEIDAVLAVRRWHGPDLVCLQAGVGSFAAAGLHHYRPTGRETAPRTAIAEPSAANCLMRSAQDGGMTVAPGPHTSTMAGLNCGLPSQLAWPVVAAATDAYVAIDDAYAHRAMALLAEAGIVAGESGAAALGALLAVADAGPADRRTVGLTPSATVLIVNTEGATDPVNYLAQVGVTADEVAATRDERRRLSGTQQL
jgi:diaminopropionate ammonia-lyase